MSDNLKLVDFAAGLVDYALHSPMSWECFEENDYSSCRSTARCEILGG